MKEAIEDYADRHDLTQSEATRRLIHDGLAREGYRADGTQNPLARLANRVTISLGALLLLGGVVALTVAYTGTLPLATTTLGILLFSLGTLTIWTATLAQLTLARPLRALAPLATTED